MSNHKIFLIMGESASGKDTLTRRLCEETGMTQLISYTTRARRNGEGDTHRFVNDETYEQMQTDNKIAAYTNINGYHYWSTKDQLYACDTYIIDAIGLKTLEDLGLTDLDLCSIYINVPFAVRLERSSYRGDDLSTFMSRTDSEMQQFINMKAHGGFDYAISNLNEEKAYSILKHIIEVETAQN